MRIFEAPDGSRWAIQVRSPGSSNAMIVFLSSDGRAAHRDRYAWFLSSGPEARNVTSRLDKDTVLKNLTDDRLRALFRKSFPLGTAESPARAATEPQHLAVGTTKS